MVSGFDDFSIHADVSFIDHPLQSATRRHREFPAQINVQPLSRERLLDDKSFASL